MPAEKASAWAIAALILGILGVCTIPIPFVPSFCVGGLGIFAGALALRSWRSDSWKNRLLALSGILLGLIPWLGWALTIASLWLILNGQK
ncbi:MAG: hypothetical protein OHK0031_05480 [Anaerolineales bacterium]